MLNTQPSLPQTPPTLPRQRGAQPSNRNALRHGLYARKNPIPLTRIIHSFPHPRPGLEGIADVIEHSLSGLRQQIDTLLSSPPNSGGLRRTLSLHPSMNHLFGLFLRLQKALLRLRQPQDQLKIVSARALDLIHYDFHSLGITRDADSFRDFCVKSYLNTPTAPASSFLTPHQWRILDPLLPSFMPEHGKMGVWGGETGQNPYFPKVGRPPSDPILLLDAAFCKLAHHARWQDLPPSSPPRLTCRRYYRRLFLSGRLWTIYKALYKDFLAHAGTSLPAMVEQGHFTISGAALTLQPGLETAWQSRTALLFLQQAWHISRRILREKEQERRRFMKFH